MNLPIILFEFLLKSALVIALGFTVVALANKAAPATKHRLWFSILTASLGMPLLLVLPRWELLPQLTSAPALPTVGLTVDQPAPIAPTITPASETPPPSTHNGRPLPESDRSLKHASAITLPRAAFALWLIGAVVIAVRAGIAKLQLRRIRRSATTPPPMWLTKFEQLKKSAGISYPVELIASPTAPSPYTWSIRQPQVVIPADLFKTAEPEEIEMILIHELEHVRRKDAAFVLISRIFLSLNWINPLAWLALRQTERLREEACDIGVMAAGHNKVKYAEVIFRHASISSAPFVRHGATAVAESGTIEQRIKMILGNTINPTNAAKERSSRFLPAILVLSVITLGALGVNADEQDEDQAADAAIERSETGFYGNLSPEVGGGRMMDFGRVGEVIYVSDGAILSPDDIKTVSIEEEADSYLVSLSLTPDALKRLQEITQAPVPDMGSLVFLLDGKVQWRRGLDKILKEKAIKVASFKRKRSAEQLARRLGQLAPPKDDAEELVIEDDDPAGDPDQIGKTESGFYATLSPQVGGGRMVFRGASGEMIYLSTNPVLTGASIDAVKEVEKDGHHLVYVTLNKEARTWLLEESKLRMPSFYTIVLIQDGEILWTRGLADIATEDSIKAAIFDKKEAAEAFAERLRKLP